MENCGPARLPHPHFSLLRKTHTHRVHHLPTYQFDTQKEFFQRDVNNDGDLQEGIAIFLLRDVFRFVH